MTPPKSSFLDKVLGRIGSLDTEGLQNVVKRLARERAFLERLFNTIEDGVMVVDENGRVIYSNAAVTRLLGPQAGAEGQHVSQTLPELDWKNISKLDNQGGPRVARHEFEVHYPRPRFLRLYATPLDGEAPGSLGVALIFHDATEARQQTFEAIESERIQALTLLAASVAHEIGNPLNALHIHLQLMEREVNKLSAPVTRFHSVRSKLRPQKTKTEPETPEIARKLENYLNVAQGEIHRLDYIITQFLQAVRPMPPQLKSGSLNEVVEKTLELLRPELDNRGIQVNTKLAPRLPLSPLDAVQIQQALVNLIKNAMQAMTRNGNLTLQTSEGLEGVWLSVADNGGGIPSELLNQIFEPFYTTKKKGTGLGLMIVQRIVRSHGGRIELESHVGRGTTFRIWLPLQERKPRQLPPPQLPDDERKKV